MAPSAILSLPLRVLIRGWQLLLSPVLGPRCRFHPSCSHYALHAIEAHGPVQGLCYAVRRLLRCHPWHPGGYDPVPPVRPSSTERPDEPRKDPPGPRLGPGLHGHPPDECLADGAAQVGRPGGRGSESAGP